MAAAVPYIISAAATYTSFRAQQDEGDITKAAFEADALAIERTGGLEEDAARKRLRQLMGTQRALFAKANVDLSTGSPLTVLAATEEEGLQDIRNIRTGTKETAASARIRGVSASAAAQTRARGTLLTGLASTASGLAG